MQELRFEAGEEEEGLGNGEGVGFVRVLERDRDREGIGVDVDVVTHPKLDNFRCSRSGGPNKLILPHVIGYFVF